MQDQNFEDQVHRKLDSMQLHPSEGVWKKVEEQISRKKKRRRFIIWLPLLFGLFTAGYFYFYPLSYAPAEMPALSRPAHHSPHAAGNQVTSLPEDNNRKYKNIPRAAEVPEKSINTSTGGMPVTKSTIAPDHFFARQIPVRVSNQHVHHRLAEHAVTGNWHTENKKPFTINDTQNSEPAAVAQLPARVIETDEGPSGNDLALNNDIAIQPAAIHEQITTTAFINTSNSITNRQSLPSASVKKHVHPAGWEWMLTAAYGKSGISNRVFSSWNGVQANAMNNFSSSGTANAVSNPPPSAIRPGTAFSAGISVRRQLYGRLSWSAGVQYTQFSNHITTGKFINDTMTVRTANPAVSQLLDQYYATGAKQPYTNRMHFIELPVQLHARLTGLQRLPVYWNVSFSVSRLIASNALQYQSGAQVYYSNNSLFNHLQCNVSTGFDVQLFTGGRHPLQVGPALSYGVTRLYTSAAADKKHLFFYGVRAALIIPQKVR